MHDWIQTYTGRQFYPTNPDPNQICIEDIAHALSNICRFSGHCKAFYSVAEHSYVLSSYITDPKLALAGLLHDAAEAYMGDITTPVKRSIGGWKGYEQTLTKLIYEKFNCAVQDTSVIAWLDLRMLLTERQQLMGQGVCLWGIEEVHHVLPLSCTLMCNSPAVAKSDFLWQFERLTAKI